VPSAKVMRAASSARRINQVTLLSSGVSIVRLHLHQVTEFTFFHMTAAHPEFNELACVDVTVGLRLRGTQGTARKTLLGWPFGHWVQANYGMMMPGSSRSCRVDHHGFGRNRWPIHSRVNIRSMRGHRRPAPPTWDACSGFWPVVCLLE